MKTVVIMKRTLFDGEISQNSKTGFLSATDLFRSGNSWRISNKLHPIDMTIWLRQKNVREFIEALKEELNETVKISACGRGHHTWVHPYLFIDMALAINPKLKIQVYSWLYDNLLKYRNESGDSYKKMAGSLYINISNKSEFRETLIWFAKKIKEHLNVIDWQTASEKQLYHRDKIHEYVSLFSDIVRGKEQVFDISVKRADEHVNEKYKNRG